ncbi:N-acetylmuramoyl-L-alanine amidase [Lutibaculum baratangense]|uniref:N-acetylmuramoyl-L-alanine amidase n=1 Tax=Lutibaculum baratangense AMV1 TaxID=631454 RepID=V4RPF9_9HYPH|nr:N-acetylmuramoyl-L-alanine amidase [Lutibaculum baratangense]ESR25080.1 N-acetylmuramoyl-L-alanine amidase [Lutibaculum baratangense AMV1]
MFAGTTRIRQLLAAVILGSALFGIGQAEAEGDAGPVVATASRLAGDEARTRFVLDLDRQIEFDVFTLADPARIVVDLPETVFQLDDTAGREGRGLVSAYRYGLFAPGKSRVVLDATGPVDVEKSFVVEAEGGEPARLVLDIVGTDRDAFLAEIALQDRKRAKPSPSPTPEAKPAGRENGRHVIVLDPGHGGIDPGAISPKGTREKDVVLAVAKKLKGDLERTGRFRVLMTRDDDIFVPLGDRVGFARKNEAALFISIHADSVRRGQVSGATVYTLSDRASDAMAAELAEQENKADAIAGVELPSEATAVADILLDLVRRETKTLSIHFARTLVDGLGRTVDMVNNPHRHAGFRVLRAHDVPSILLELGYLSSSNDEKRLLDGEWQEKVSSTVTRVIERFFGDRQARSPF